MVVDARSRGAPGAGGFGWGAAASGGGRGQSGFGVGCGAVAIWCRIGGNLVRKGEIFSVPRGGASGDGDVSLLLFLVPSGAFDSSTKGVVVGEADRLLTAMRIQFD